MPISSIHPNDKRIDLQLQAAAWGGTGQIAAKLNLFYRVFLLA